jgi:uncharacterized OsmC-like protein
MAQATVLNGVDAAQLGEKAQALRQTPELGKFNFRITNKWRDGGFNQSTATDFHGLQQDIAHAAPFVLDADEPPVLLGEDRGANPVEHLLHALAGCLTSSIVYHAAVHGIAIEELESTVEGDIDVRAFMGLTDEVRRGYQNIRVTFRVKSDAPKEQLAKLAEFSPVLDVVSHGTDVSIDFEEV